MIRGAEVEMASRPQLSEIGADLLELVGEAVVVTDGAGRIWFLNQTAMEMFGYAPEELSGASVEILMPSRFRADHRSYVSAFSREEGKATRIMGHRRPLIARKRTGEEFYIEATVTRHAMQGQAAMAIVIRDVSAQRRLEEEVAAKNAAIARNERRMQLALKAGRMGTWSWDRASAEFYYDAQTCRLLGLGPEMAASASRALRRLYEEDRARLLQDIRMALSERRPFSTEVQVKTADGKRRWVSFKGEAAEGRPNSLFGVVTEATEAHELEELRATIWGELNHRVRNQMAMVRSLVWLTARDAESLESYVRKLEDRLQLFTDDLALPPDGQDTVLDVRDVVKAETRIYEARVFLEGPDAALSRPSAVSLRLALHELTTNAVKYGALGSPDGRLDVTWRVHTKVDSDRLALTWRESGGPAAAPPTRRGFGVALIEQCIRRQLRGDLHLEYRPEGLWCRICIPLP